MIPGGQCLRGVPGVHEQQRGVVLLDELLGPPHAGDELRVALQRSRQILVLLDDLGALHPDAHLLGHLGPDYSHLAADAAQVVRHLLVRADGGRKADPLELASQFDHPLQGHGQLRPPLVVGQLVDLVHHHVADVGQMRPQVLAGEHDLQRLRGGDQYVGSELGLPLPFRLGGIPMPHGHPQVEGLPELLQALEHVPVQGTEGSDVQQPHPLSRGVDELVEQGQHGRLGLADAGRRDQEHVLPGQHRGYGLALSPGRLLDVLVLQHLADAGVQQFEYHVLTVQYSRCSSSLCSRYSMRSILVSVPSRIPSSCPTTSIREICLAFMSSKA
ncbi:MAG: hypothetical protein A4E30_00661 [Methanomassiliicoccales archaeon PtaB.Bin215]|nr:MAG: hypothetical protein A4E30_00661 [Methanomassiliicoccales archaeon PtaB.Bin215]